MSLPPQPHDPTPEEAIALFEALEAKFPSKTLGDEKWYLVATSALAGCEPDFIPRLYTYLISKPAYTTPASRQTLMRRLREALVKDISILGVCRPMQAIFGIAKIERDEDKDYSFSRQHWQSGPEMHERGVNWLNTLYQENKGPTMRPFNAHQDFDWITNEITYGLYLSDHSILGPVETQLVVLSGIMIQNLRPATGWHLRGIRRIGVSSEDVELIQQCVEMVARFAGVRVDKVPRVVDIEHEV